MAKKKGKFILSIGDEGAILTYMQGKAVARRMFAPSANYSDTRGFLELFEGDKDAPISMMVDVMDQSYVQQSLPPVSSLSVNNLIKRKMERDFAADDLKGALQIGREKEGRRDWKYLFVTLSRSPQLESWIDLVIDLPNRFEGIYLLPVEAENFMHRLRDGLKGKPAKKPKVKKPKKGEAPAPEAEAAPQPPVPVAANSDDAAWQLLVAHNKVGGFRQVVLKNGKLIFARLAQPIGDNQPEVIAGNIEQEVSVTIEYLKRLGYSDDQGMDVYVITSEYIKASIDRGNINASSAYILTPYEAARKIGLEAVAEPNDQFADVLLAAAFATAKKRLLKLETAEQQKLNKLYGALLAVKGGSVVATLAAIGAIGYYGLMIPTAQEEIENSQRQIRSAEQDLARVKELEKNLPDNLEKITDLVAMHQLLTNLGLSPDEALRRIGMIEIPGHKLYLQSFDWSTANSVLAAPAGNQPRTRNTDNTNASGETLSLKLSFEMYGTSVGSEDFNLRIDDLMSQMRSIFAGFEVVYTGQRPGNEGEDEIIDLQKERARDPILDMPFWPVSFEITGTGVVEEKKEEGRR